MGFVVNCMFILMINEVVSILVEGVVIVEDIDKVMKLGVYYLMGLLVLVDLIGNDVNLLIMELFYSEIGDLKYCVYLLLRKMVCVNYLGCKFKKGFFEYK